MLLLFCPVSTRDLSSRARLPEPVLSPTADSLLFEWKKDIL